MNAFRTLVAAALIALFPATVMAQSSAPVVFDTPNTVNKAGQPVQTSNVFMRDALGNIVSPSNINCTTVTGTLTAQGQAATINCPNAGAFSVVVTPSSFVGSITFASGTGAPKRVIRNGQAPLQISTVPFVAADAGPRYYATNGGNSLVVNVSNYTSGSITVSISATAQALYPIPIGEYQTSALVALLNGRGFTGGFPGGTLNVANNNLACLTIANPAGSGVRGIYEARLLSTDVVSSQQPPRYYVVNNATTGLPTTAATINNRGVGGSSVMTLTYGSLAALPTGGATGLGGYVQTNGATLNLLPEKTIEPGTNQTMCMIGVQATGTLGATSSPSILLAWREQALN